ncbi:MAG: 16S rRNA (uracil(1498)-N(3))-methyltransferase [Sphingomonadaceae bacterium]
MPATPAWPPASLPRLFVAERLEEGAAIRVEGNAARYLVRVLRLAAGAEVKLFDDETGEWLARIAHVGRRDALLAVEAKLRERETPPDVWLCFAPLKKGRIDWLVEKATELGAARLVPVRTARTVVGRVNPGRLRAHIVEAAEQCERTALPELADLIPLDRLLADWPAERALFFADEGGGEAFRPDPGPAAILIGPEGGFTDEERVAIRALPRARPVSLGPRILRADTAALAALALWMASAGDWHRAPRA